MAKSQLLNDLRALGVLFSRDLVIFKGPLYHSSTEQSFAERERDIPSKTRKYMNTVKLLKWVPATSEIVERLFSRVSLVYND